MTDRVVALLVQQIREHARSASEVGDAGSPVDLSQPHAGRYQPDVAFRSKDVIAVRGGVTVEERYFLLLILRWQGCHFDFLAR